MKWLINKYLITYNENELSNRIDEIQIVDIVDIDE